MVTADLGRNPRHSRKRIPGYVKPKKRCHHRYEPDKKGVKRCVYCNKLPKSRAKSRDPKDKVRNAAHTQRRMPPPQRSH